MSSIGIRRCRPDRASALSATVAMARSLERVDEADHHLAAVASLRRHEERVEDRDPADGEQRCGDDDPVERDPDSRQRGRGLDGKDEDADHDQRRCEQEADVGGRREGDVRVVVGVVTPRTFAARPAECSQPEGTPRPARSPCHPTRSDETGDRRDHRRDALGHAIDLVRDLRSEVDLVQPESDAASGNRPDDGDDDEGHHLIGTWWLTASNRALVEETDLAEVGSISRRATRSAGDGGTGRRWQSTLPVEPGMHVHSANRRRRDGCRRARIRLVSGQPR